MSLSILMIAVTVMECEGLPEKACDRIKIENQFYDKQVLWADAGRPFNLNIHLTTNTLFLSYTVPETYSDLDFQLAQMNIDTKEYIIIAGIKGGCATAIDNANDEIYLGGSDGIYKYDMATKLAELYREKDKNIWSLFHRHNLFYVTYPEQRLFMGIDDKFAIVKEFQNFEVDQFFTTIKEDIYFSNRSGFFKYNKSKLRAEIIYDLITVRQIVEDNTGKVYICTNFGLFVVKENSLEQVSTMKIIYGLAFDKDNNFIMSDDKRVMKLVKSNKSCVSTDHW